MDGRPQQGSCGANLRERSRVLIREPISNPAASARAKPTASGSERNVKDHIAHVYPRQDLPLPAGALQHNPAPVSA
jgi:hypothetical protein